MRECNITASVLCALSKEFHHSCAVEIKVCKKETFSFSSLLPHQERALWLANGEKGIYFKIPDCGYQNPFDGFIMKSIDAGIAIVFNTSIRGEKECWFIPIEKWFLVKNISRRKSLTLQDAKIYGIKIPL